MPMSHAFRSFRTVLGAALATCFVAGTALAEQPNTYQVTGPVLEVREDVIVVQKGKEKWEIARDTETKITGDLKVGSKVTIEYRMKAANVEVKGAGKAAKAAGKESEKPADKTDTKATK